MEKKFYLSRNLSAIILVSMMISASGCKPQNTLNPSTPLAAPNADQGAPERLAEILRSTFDEQNVDAAIEALARAGVRVYADDGVHLIHEVSGKPSALKLFRQQVRNMALLASTGEGSSAQDLNAFVPAIKLKSRSLPISAVLAAYVMKGETFGARLSRNLVGDVTIKQHESTSWPTLVLALFLADTVPPEARKNAFLPMPVAHAADGPCGVANDFLNSAGRQAVETITGPPEGGSSLDFLFSLIAAAADAIFGMAGDIAREAVSEALGLATLQKVMFAINLIATAQALFEQWTVEIVPEPAQIDFINHGSKIEGRFKATVIGGEGISWPRAIQECAALLGFSLPGSPSAPGSKAKWMTLDGFGTYVAETGRDLEIKPDNTAELGYKAIRTEDPSLHSGGGETKREIFRAILIVENTSKEALKDFLVKVNSVIGSFVPAGIQADVFKLLVAPWGSGKSEIEHHKSRAAASSFSKGPVSMRAYTCNAPTGPWNYTVTHAFGSTANGTFSVPGAYNWTMSGFAVIAASGTVALQGDSLIFSGGTVAKVPKVPQGVGASADSFSVPIVYEDVPECRAN